MHSPLGLSALSAWTKLLSWAWRWKRTPYRGARSQTDSTTVRNRHTSCTRDRYASELGQKPNLHCSLIHRERCKTGVRLVHHIFVFRFMGFEFTSMSCYSPVSQVRNSGQRNEWITATSSAMDISLYLIDDNHAGINISSWENKITQYVRSRTLSFLFPFKHKSGFIRMASLESAGRPLYEHMQRFNSGFSRAYDVPRKNANEWQDKRTVSYNTRNYGLVAYRPVVKQRPRNKQDSNRWYATAR
jgi:hypothetical protein